MEPIITLTYQPGWGHLWAILPLFSFHFTEWEGSQGGVQSHPLRATQLITAEPAVHSPPDICPPLDALSVRRWVLLSRWAVGPEKARAAEHRMCHPSPNPGHSEALGSCQCGIGGREWQSFRPPEDLRVQGGYGCIWELWDAGSFCSLSFSCTPACCGNIPLGMASLHHLQISRSSPVLVTGWVNKAEVSLFLGLSWSSSRHRETMPGRGDPAVTALLH